MPVRRTAASPITSPMKSPTFSSPTTSGEENAEGGGALSIRDKIRLGKEKRKEELNAPKPVEETDKEKELAAEREELVSGVQMAINFIIALVFVSMPLSEDEIDWFLVAFFIVVNAVWNFFFHQNTTPHIAVLLLLNFVSAQYSDQLKKLPAVLVKIDPVYYAAFISANSVLGALGYYLYVRKVDKKTPERESRIDHVSLVIMAINFFALVGLGVITPTQIAHFFRLLWMAVTNLSVNG